ncbi:MAG: hypothetical protein ACJATT_001739 [Myxococcota bacterium]|jgi:uncharacterized protein YcaQ
MLSRDEARDFMVGHHGLRAVIHPSGDDGVRAMLQRRRCIQLDPLAPIGTNADLVAMARLDDVTVGQVYRALLPGHAFEHYSKELCLIPQDRFATWHGGAQDNPTWRMTQRMRDISADVLDAVEAEIHARGPVAVADLASRGRVTPSDWSGWKGTPKMATLAVKVLWRQCRIVICGRQGRGKVVDVPERALPSSKALPFNKTVLVDRAIAAGLLSEVSGPHWSMLNEVRKSPLVDELIDDGLLERICIDGDRRTYLMASGALERSFPDDDGRMRILGPLDSMLWDRKLVAHVFGFEYVWEVYKPSAKRQYGWYVVPLLHKGQLVGRLEARFVDGKLRVDDVWPEADGLDEIALKHALARHERLLQGAN